MALTLYLLTFNCARTLVQPHAFAPHVFDALEPGTRYPDLLVLNLQEIAPIAYGFLGGSFLTPYFDCFQKVVKLAAKDQTYVHILSQNLGMTGIMVFAREDVADNINWTQSAGVGVGLGAMGAKGAVGIRLGYRIGDSEEVELTFVAAHLAAMEDALERRNFDYQSIVQGLVFVQEHRAGEDENAPLLRGSAQPKPLESGIYSSTSHLFLAGDLNYRTSLIQPSPHDVEHKFPQPAKEEDDPRHFIHLLAEDQLTQQVKAGKALHGLTEAPIRFPPTYKYRNVGDKAVTLDGEGDWQWARHRWPSWCDRIFFWKTEHVKVEPVRYTCLPLFATSDHRPVALLATVPLRSVSGVGLSDSATPPFPIDPQWRSKRAWARKKELAVGLLAYLVLTKEGAALALATTVGVVGVWMIARSILVL
ncbi:hypothetical protein B0A52_06847 [Exophiala mesophila]|uniref:Inositol polyphosphate-related phosphatase domain-containing protein n=1 Tax=Exophiala mesophila TaxID=212818 RepID=A0A438N097_EXOME|nr:hypothetical protein B0A52_06847 [Exophiala mesophila]